MKLLTLSLTSIRNMFRFDTPPLNEKSTVFIPDEPLLSDKSSRFKQDIWLFTTDAQTPKKTVTIIEIIYPYSMDTDIRREDKLKKYELLVDDIKSTWNVDVSLHVIVVSSQGVITPKVVKRKLYRKSHSNTKFNKLKCSQ